MSPFLHIVELKNVFIHLKADFSGHIKMKNTTRGYSWTVYEWRRRDYYAL